MDEQLVARNAEVARRVCEAWNVMALEEFQRLFDPQVDYRNIPIEGDVHRSPEAVYDILSRFRAKWDIALQVHNLVADERIVMTERVEHFVHRAGQKPSFDLPVMGIFEVHDGRVTHWRDYFERAHLRLR